MRSRINICLLLAGIGFCIYLLQPKTEKYSSPDLKETPSQSQILSNSNPEVATKALPSTPLASAVVTAPPPVTETSKPATSNPSLDSTMNTHDLPPVQQPDSSVSTAAPAPANQAPKVFVAPSPLPAQANWTWTTTDGRTYTNVIIKKVEADCVTILDDDGGTLVPISTLPPSLQKQLNYDEKLAAAAAAERNNEDSASRAVLAQEKASHTQELIATQSNEDKHASARQTYLNNVEIDALKQEVTQEYAAFQDDLRHESYSESRGYEYSTDMPYDPGPSSILVNRVNALAADIVKLRDLEIKRGDAAIDTFTINKTGDDITLYQVGRFPYLLGGASAP